MQICSYRAVFDLERRIYRIDALRLNPSGVPLRGIAYFAALLVAMLAAGLLPLLGGAVRVVPWYMRGVIAPGVAAAAMSMVRVDGRPFHRAAPAIIHAAVCSGWRERSRSARRWRPTGLVVLPDGAQARRLLYIGPGAVRVGVEHVLRDRVRGRGRAGRRCDVELSLSHRSTAVGADMAVEPHVCSCARAAAGPGRRVIVLAARARLEVKG